MGNKAGQTEIKGTDSLQLCNNSTQVTIKGVVVSISQGSKRIQLLTKDGALSNNIITVENDCILSSNKINLKKVKSNNNIILYSWLRQYTITTLMDRNIIEQILKYARYEFSIRLTLPLSLGKVASNDHYLCIRQIQVYSSWNQFIKLSFKDGSKCIKRGSQGRTPLKCIDGDLSIGSFTVNHPDYSNQNENDSEDHWMEFIIDNVIDDVNDIGKIKIYNRDQYKHRIVGCIVQLYKDGIVAKSWTLENIQDIYQLDMD